MGATFITKFLLAYRSGDRCALPDCGGTLAPETDSGNPTNVGQAAHIAGEKSGKGNSKRSARYDPNMGDKQRNHYNNLIYLCPTCHTKIDTIPEGAIDYSVERLHKIKKEHEAKVREAILEAFADVGFLELQEATQWVVNVTPSAVRSDFSLLKLEDKIKKNDLDREAHGVIAMGLGVARDVEHYIQTVAQDDDQFPERLQAGFLAEYWKLKNKGLKGGELFEMMCRFAQRGIERQAKRAAGLAVLIYLFEVCEVFEK